MFRFAHLGRVWWPVELPYGNEDGGDPVTIHLLFQLMTDEELDAREHAALTHTVEQITRDLAKPPAGEGDASPIDEATQIREQADAVVKLLAATQAAKLESRADLLKRVTDWRDVVDDAEQPEPFTPGKLEALLQHRPFFVAVRDALLTASRDGVSKNSLPGPAGLPARVQA
ncbi:hypothetical protein [Luteimonas terrae]|uniref:Uncharacterized protein n=1 Tax=Luteimonas terrae TaxID=1530191 RepID=A0ABU1XX60_9GAMM|nr:hypothetical protein [Luteimonas terrae]MDR7193352.1 hypothetical protein [Luteimonas terrae]